MDTKICSKCKIEKPLNQYYKHSKNLMAHCKNCHYSKGLEWLELNQDRRLIHINKYRENNRKIMLERSKTWCENNLKYDAFRAATYRCVKIKQCPKWANLEKVKQIYKNCPKGYNVDHIVPLRGKLVCGLHVEYNLQYLKANENFKKGNRFNE